MMDELKAGRELDALIAEKVMGGLVDGDPERWDKKSETWFYIHSSSGVLIGNPYHVNVFREDNEPMLYSHSWRKFQPSTDLVDAIAALETKYQYVIIKEPRGYTVKTWVNEYSGARRAEAETLPLAACRSLLAWD
jgi:hypothetical protein